MGILEWTFDGGVGRLVVGCIAIVIAIFVAVMLPINFIRAGVVTEFEGTVQLVNRNNFIMPHTHVVLQTYAGDNDEFTLAGYHIFEVGRQYKVRYVNQLYVGGLWLLGNLQEAEIQDQ